MAPGHKLLFRWRAADVLICFGLALLIWIDFGQALDAEFLNYDDPIYVTQNPQVNGGTSWTGIVWAFSHSHAGNWHPLTTISHMLDCEFFDLHPRPHHGGNLFWHSGAAVLLFLFLRRTTANDDRNRWQSAFVAALFALHPLRCESVAWVAERKDVLSAFFLMLTLIAYSWYTRRPSLKRYFVPGVFCLCGLLSKAMLVTVPIILLLLDYWPLRRLTGWSKFPRLLTEKVPLFALVIAIGVITFIIQEHSLGSLIQLPLSWRVENAIVSYVTYLWQMVWPVGLIVFYPHPENHLRPWQVIGAASLLIGLTITALRFRISKPYLATGWLWYGVMLLPVIGLIEVGLQGHADRYTYLPQIGLYLALTWLISDLWRSFEWPKQILATSGGITVLLLSLCSWKQTSYWHDSRTLWSHALALTPQSEVAQTNLGIALMDHNQIGEAIEHFQTALDLRSGNNQPHYALTLALIHTNLGYAFARLGKVDDAMAQWREALQFQPNYPDAHYDLATILSQQGAVDDAIHEYRETLAARPDDVEAHTSLANALIEKGQLRDAVKEYEMALKIAPHSILPANNLAWILSAGPDQSLRNGLRAVELADLVEQQTQGMEPQFLRTLAAAYAECGRFPEATAAAERALQLAHNRRDTELARDIADDVGHYRDHQPLRDPGLNHTR